MTERPTLPPPTKSITGSDFDNSACMISLTYPSWLSSKYRNDRITRRCRVTEEAIPTASDDIHDSSRSGVKAIETSIANATKRISSFRVTQICETTTRAFRSEVAP